MLLPFLFLPYRWIWLPCALGGTLLLRPDPRAWRQTLHRDGTLIVGSGIVLLMRTFLDPGWWAPWMAFLAVAFWLRRRWSGSRPLAVGTIAITWIVSGLTLLRPGLHLPSGPAGAIDRRAVLVCAGDSLTSGVVPGSDAQTYVAYLRERLPCTVLNAGVANDLAGDLLKRLDRDVLTKHPTAVALFIGGNDSLDGTPRREFQRQLDRIAARITAARARLVIVEVPSGIIWNPYAGLYRKVASRYGAVLVPESRLRLWFSLELLARDWLREPLTIDGLHFSPAGARRVADWLEPYAWAAVE